MTTAIKSKLHIRWMIRRDMDEVHAIEHESFSMPWSEKEFIQCLRQRNCIGMVVEYDEKVVGFMVYELHKDRLTVLNFAVSPWYRRAGVGSSMVAKLVGKLCYERRRLITLIVRETNLDAQKFFKSLGFVATGVLKERYDDEDAYQFEYRYGEI